jgi:hypothetical protein
MMIKKNLVSLSLKSIVIFWIVAPGRVLGQVPNYVPASGLQGWWPFTGNANDVGPSGFTSTVVSATPTFDRFNSSASAYLFSGVSHITTSFVGILGQNPRAVSFWAKFSSSAAMSGVSWGDHLGTASRYECGFNYGAPGPMIDGGNGCITYSPVVPANDDKWHHYVVQFGNSSALAAVNIYQDAILLSTTSNVYVGTNTLTTTSFSTVMFGALPNGQHQFTGTLDDIGIWNRTLTKCEIGNLYSAALTPTLVATATPSAVCYNFGQTSTMIVNGNAQSYTWSPGNVNSISQVVTPSTVAVYTVTGVNAYSCKNTATLIVRGMICEGIPEINNATSNLLFYPNPPENTVTVHSCSDIILTDIQGCILRMSGNHTKDQQQHSLDLRDLPAGIYLLRDEKGNASKVTLNR